MVLDDAFNSFPVLDTPRLILRQVTKEDAKDVFSIFAHAQVTEYYDLDTFSHVEEADRWGITKKPNDRIIGTCGVTPRSNGRGGLGYDLSRDYWRQGIMTEALNAIISFAFETMELNRLEALVMPGNLPSEQLLLKLGFTEEGILREYAFYKDRFHDLKSFSILRRDRDE
jgi:ribosomal-protein-alanine N-acetyltransferase